MSNMKSPEEVAELFRVSVDFVRRNARENKWPHYRLGERTIAFSDEQIEAIKKMSERTPVDKSKRRISNINELLSRVA
ncbi:MAG: hypothetical protein WBA28_04965 [Microbacteriaceae bacterium]